MKKRHYSNREETQMEGRWSIYL